MRRLAIVALLPLLMAGCSRFPVYQSVPPGPETAQIRFRFEGGGVWQVMRHSRATFCGLEGGLPETLYSRSANPLLPDANLDGVRVKAGDRLYLMTLSMGVRAGYPNSFHTICQTPGSFVPEPGAVYELRVTHDPQASNCSSWLVQLEPVQRRVSDYRPVTCQ